VARLPNQVFVALPNDAIDALHAEAESEATSLSAVIRRIVLAELRRRESAAA